MENHDIEYVLKKRDQLPRKQRQIYDLMLQNAERIMQMTAQEAAAFANSSKATLFRLIHNLGYSSYNNFRVDLLNITLSVNKPVYWALKDTIHSIPVLENASWLHSTTSKSIDSMSAMLTQGIQESFDSAVEKLLSSNEIALLGFRTSIFIANYLESLLLSIPIPVTSLCNQEHFVFERIARLSPNSTVIIFSRWPYTTTSVKAAKHLHSLGHSIILITNNSSCAITDYADITINISSAYDTFTITPFITMAEALANNILAKLTNKTVNRLESIEQVLRENDWVRW